jgi:phosphate transport system permease protein
MNATSASHSKAVSAAASLSPATKRLYLRRNLTNTVAVTLAVAAALFGLAFLGWILWTLIANGIAGLNLALFTQDQPPPLEAGGLRNAFVGSILICGIGVLIGTPLGIAAGTWLAEYGHRRKLGTIVRFVNDILLSAPSIVLGLFVYTLVVRPMGGFSGLAGVIALAFIVLPVVVRTTDDMLKLVPAQMREAALSLGIPQWKVTLQILYRAAAPGIVTGVLLALARISGETAPLLFTALNNQYWSADLSEPIASAPVVIFQYAMSPFEDWHALAWAGAFLITVFVLVLSLFARLVLLRKRVPND